MKRIWKFYSFFMIIFILSAGLLQAAPVGKITNLEGKVDVLKVGKNAATPVSLGDPVDVGDIYRAKSNSKAEITFINNNLLRIAPNTRIEIKEYMVQGDQSSGVAKLHRGRAQIVAAEEFIKKAAAFAEGNKFEIHTPNAVAGIRGTNMIVFHERGLTGVLFVSGRGYVYNPTVPDKVVPVTAGNISFVTAPTAPPTPPAKASEAEITKQVNAVTIPAKTTVVKAEVAEKAPQAPAEAPKAATVVTTKEPAETVETTKITTTVTTEKLFQETTTQAQVVKTTGIVTLPQTTIPSIQQTPAVITTSTTKQTDVPPVTQQVAQEERPPVVKITSQPDPLTNVNTATFTLTADKNASFAYNLNSAGWVSIATGNQSTLTLQNIPEGQNSIIFRATDPLTGKFSETSSFSWKTDYTLPDVKVTQNVSPGTNNTSQMKVDFTTTNKPQGYVSYEYRLDGGPWVVVSGSSAIIQNIINGTHTIEYRAKDKAGNTVSSSLSFESKTYSLPSSIAGTGFTGTSKTDFSILSGTGQVSGVATNTGAYTTTLTLQGTLPPQPKINLGGTGSYWMENMKMNVSGDNVTGQSEFIYISGKELATGTGTITGSKGASGQWNATSTGTWNSASLIYSGAMDHTQAFISPGEGASNQSRIKGLLGTTKNITFAGVGEFDDQGLRAFGAPVTGKNWDTGAYSTSGLFGLRLGSDSETVNTMKARMLGIYVKPLGNNRYEAGYLDTGLASSDTPAGGQFYRDINMWKINSGILTEEKKTASDIISPISPVVDYSSTLIQGTINLGGQYQGIVQGNILSIKDQPWGVFIAGFGGYNETTPATIISGGKIEGQGENGYWIARGDITKNEDVAFYAPFKKGNFLTNNYIGQLKDGEFFGTYENGPYTGLALAKYDMLPLTLNGQLTESSFLYNGIVPTLLNEEGFIKGIFGGRPFTGGILSLTFMGEYHNPNLRNVFLVPMTAAMAGGGSFYGYLGGIRGKDDSLEGRVLGIQIVTKTDGTYQAGYITSGSINDSPITGRFYPSIGMWETTAGGLTVVNMAPTLIKPEEITQNMGAFGYTSPIAKDITGSMDYTFVNLLYQNWGMWLGTSGGTYTTGPTSSWKAYAGGSIYEGSNPAGYSLAEFEGKSWTDHKIYGLVTGKSIGYHSLINFSGDFLGTNDPVNKKWQATSLGTFTESPLFFVSPLSAYLMYNSEGYLSFDGNLNGLLGSPYENWSQAVSIGTYAVNSNNPTHVWISQIHSYDYTTSTYKAYGGGSFKGYAGGIERNNTIEGKLISFYVKDGKVGIMEGDIGGKVYPQINMYTLDVPALTYTPMTTLTGVTEETLASFIQTPYNPTYSYYNSKLTGMYGSLTGSSYAIFSYLKNPDTFAHDPWGIFKMEVAGNTTNPIPSWTGRIGGYSYIGGYTPIGETPPIQQDSGYWISDITNGTWADNRLTGNMVGKFLTYTKMGDIEGTILGTYNQDNSFQAISLGKWKGDELKFSSEVNSSIRHTSHRYSGGYTYGDNSTYSYSYLTDNTSGYTSYIKTDGSYVSTYYKPDKTKEVYDSTTGNTTYGTWDPDTFNLSSLANDPYTGGTPVNQTSVLEDTNTGYFSALLGGKTSLFSGTTTPVTLISSYSGSMGASIWYTDDLLSRNIKDSAKPYTTYDGGAYKGYLAGIKLGNNMEGNLLALYIDPNGNGGYLKGSLSGKIYPEINMLKMDGTINRVQKALSQGVGVEPSKLESSIYPGWINGNVSASYTSGSFTGSLNGGSTMAIYTLDESQQPVIQKWGIYGTNLSGTLNTSLSNPGTWTGKIGGEFTKLIWGCSYSFCEDNGYWLSDITGSAMENKITGSLSGKILNERTMGTLAGDLLGTYNPKGKTWEGISLGTWDVTDLTFASNVNTVFIYNKDGNLTYDGGINGYLGGTTTPWGAFIAMGHYAFTTSNPTHIWLSDIYSFDFVNGVNKTYDGGAFKGYLGGIKTGDNLEGRFLALYVDKNGNTGYIEGNPNGKVYPDLNMFYLDNQAITYTPMPTVTGVTADTFNYIVYDSGSAYIVNGVEGTFGGGGRITGKIDISFQSFANNYTFKDDLWGIYKMETYGIAENPGTSWTGRVGGGSTYIGVYKWHPDTNQNPLNIFRPLIDENGASFYSDPAYWIASINDGTWSAGKITGTLAGRFITYTKMGDMDGTILGTYNQDNSFQAISLGKWKGDELKFFNFVNLNLIYNNSAHFGNPVYDGNISAYMGGTASLWNSSSTPFTIMGNFFYNDESHAGNHYWAQNIYPYNAKILKNLTYDEGTYYGFLAGIDRSVNNTVEGNLYALYIDPEGKAGVLKGTFNGNHYPGINMLKADGSITSIQLNSNIGIIPSSLPNGWISSMDYLNVVPIPSIFDNRSSEGLFVDGNLNILGGTSKRGDTLGYGYLTNDPGFGIWQMDSWGVYDPQKTAERFILVAGIESPTSSYGKEHIFEIFTRNTWGGGKIKGSALGAGGGWERGWTAVMAGESLGTYIESPDKTFGLLTTGAYIMTERYLSMLDETSVDYSANKAKLETLGFPTKNVANVDLASLSTATTGTNTSGNSINVKNVRLFSNDAGNIPYLWATAPKEGTADGISASYQGNMAPNNTIVPNSTGTAYTRISFQNMGRSDLTGSDNWLAEVFGIGALMLNNGTYAQGSWSGAAAGTYETTHEGEVISSYSFKGSASGLFYPSTYISQITHVADNNIAYLLSYTGSDYIRDGYFKGLLGSGPVPLWKGTPSNPSSFDLMGLYFPGIPPELPQPPESMGFTMNSQDHVFGFPLYPINFENTSKPYTTTDGGSYWGYLIGAHRGLNYYYANGTTPWWSGPIEGTIATLYIDPEKRSGIILGRFGNIDTEDPNIFGSWFDAENRQWWAEGKMYPVELATTNVLPENLKTSIASSTFGISIPESNGGFKNAEGSISLASIGKPFDAISYWINDVPYMGIWASGFFGNFTSNNPYSPAPNGWGFILNGQGAGMGRYITLAIEGGPWTDRKIEGNAAGAWADIKTIMRDSYTGVMVGKVNGTFDLSQLTYQAVMVGPWLETNKFLELAASEAGRKKLEALNIPSVVVGSATLTQQGTNPYLSNVAITNAQFFSTANGGKPILWAAGGTSGGVSGNYNGNPLNQSVNLAGNGLTASFNMKAWDTMNNRWLSTITNGSGTLSGGSYTGPVQFQGAGAGTINQGAGSFSGTAAGFSR